MHVFYSAFPLSPTAYSQGHSVKNQLDAEQLSLLRLSTPVIGLTGPRWPPSIHLPMPVPLPSSHQPHATSAWHSLQVLWREQRRSPGQSEEGFPHRKLLHMKADVSDNKHNTKWSWCVTLRATFRYYEVKILEMQLCKIKFDKECKNASLYILFTV